MSLLSNHHLLLLKKLNNIVIFPSTKCVACATICVLLLSGCGRRAVVVANTWSHHDVSANQARLSDVALPLKITPVASGAGQHTVIYTVKGTRAVLTDFYLREMERLGWVVVGYTDTSESLLLFDKTSRVCVVSIRENMAAKNPLHGMLSRNGCYVRIDIINKSVAY